MKIKLLLIPLLLILVEPSFSQEIANLIGHLGKEEGLINDTGNYFISEDSRGFIWISSLNGFYRYDGLELTHFLIPTNENDSFVSDQFIQSSFLEDENANLWFTSYNSLHCYNRKEDKITNLRAPGKIDEVDHSYHLFYYESQQRCLWLRAGDHVWAYNLGSNTWKQMFPTSGIRFAVKAGLEGQVNAIIACAWLKGSIVVNQRQPAGHWSSQSFLNPEFEIRSALVDQDSTAWLFAKQGLLKVNFYTGKLLRHEAVNDQKIGLDLYSGVFLSKKQMLAIATNSSGVLYFDTEEEVFLKRQSGREQSVSLVNTSPRSFLVDSNDQIWISRKQGGVDCLRLGSKMFQNLHFSGATNFLLEDHQQNIWALLSNGTILNVKESGQYFSVPTPQSNTPIRYITIDHDGSIWGISATTIYRTAGGEWEKVFEGSNELISIYASIPGRTLLITKKGVFDLKQSDSEMVLQPSQEFSAFAGFNFYHFYPLEHNTTMIPFESKDLWLIRLNSDYKLEVIDRLSIGGDTFSGRYSSSGDSIWIGSNLGLWLYHNGKAKLALNSLKELNGANVYGLLHNGSDLWLSTNLGLEKYEIAKNRLTHFGKEEGLANIDFSSYAYLKSSSGHFWFGHKQGLTVFHPDSIQMDFPVPAAHLEDMWVNNVPYDPGMAISEASSINLHYQENTLSFELKAVGFYQPQASQLKYRLLGYDNDWVTVGNGGFARFTKIPPGQYNLEVVPLNANGMAGDKHELSISIKPPFWQTLWFKITVVFSVLFLFGVIVGAYYRQKLRKQQRLLEKQQALNEERNRIAKELHDDMGSSLSSILFLSEDLLMEEERHEVERISSLAEQSLENMREIIWAFDTDKDTIQDLTVRLRSFIVAYLTDNKLHYDLDFSNIPEQDIVLGGEYRRNIYLVAKEALHNVVKHAQATEVGVSLSVKHQMILLSIVDNGVGIPEAITERSGHGLTNMEKRATAIGATLEIKPGEEGGTQLKLIIPLQKLL